MRVLLLAVGLTGCYDAGAVDCTLSCGGSGECASGQVCGSDGFCAAPDIAGHCVASTDDGGGMVAGDAAVDSQPDGGVRVPLHLKIDGDGRVTVTGYGACEKTAPDNGDCTFQVALAQQLDLVAAPYPTRIFEAWTGTPCALQDETCTFIPFGSNDIHAKFK
ncbi:MAG: hypothetical protein HOV81_12485 [Kofleriaceae bacterium]|nr:hypothetical protein [Kofleriaceae bacterium]